MKRQAFKRAGLYVEADDLYRENENRQKNGQPLRDIKRKCPPKNAFRHSFVTYHVALHRQPRQDRPHRQPSRSGLSLPPLSGDRDPEVCEEEFRQPAAQIRGDLWENSMESDVMAILDVLGE